MSKVGYGSLSWRLKPVTLRVVASLPFFLAAMQLNGHKVTSDYELTPISLPGASGVVASLCVIDAQTLKRGECLQVAPPSAGPAAAPDAVVYVAATKELWITTGAPPIGVASADKAIQVFDVSEPRHLRLKLKIPLDGSAEGYAVDNQRGLV